MTSEVSHPPTDRPNTRQFNVGDALILMAALCLGLSGIRDRVRTLPARTGWWLDEYRRFRAEAAGIPPMSDDDYHFSLRSLEYYLTDELEAWLTSCLIALAPAQMLMRLRPPRPEWRTLLRQPGFLGCCAASAGFCVDKGWVPFLRFESLSYPYVTAMAVLVAWAVLLGSRRCIAERSWVDRLGRLVGLGWVLAGLWSQIDHYYFW
jgi:hypothetical protein